MKPISKMFRAEGAEGPDIVSTLKKHFPCFSKSTLSMVENPQKYGVQLTAKARRILREAYTPHPAEDDEIHHVSYDNAQMGREK